jgi:hypothetical protein
MSEQQTTTALARPVDLDTVEGVWQLAARVQQSGFMGQQTPQQVFTLMMIAQAEGLHPIEAMRRYDVIQGRPAMKSAAMLAEFQRQGGRIAYLTRSDEVVEIEVSAPNAEPVRVRWTMERARRMGLGDRDNWRKQPMTMLTWRAVAEGVRLTMPGVIVGIYSDDEARDELPPPPAVAVVEDSPALAAAVAAHRELVRLGPAGVAAASAIKRGYEVDSPRDLEGYHLVLFTDDCRREIARIRAAGAARVATDSGPDGAAAARIVDAPIVPVISDAPVTAVVPSEADDSGRADEPPPEQPQVESPPADAPAAFAQWFQAQVTAHGGNRSARTVMTAWLTSVGKAGYSRTTAAERAALGAAIQANRFDWTTGKVMA